MVELLARPSVRVVHVITDLRTGGAEMQLLRLARASLRSPGPELVGVVALGTGGPIADRMESEGIRVWRLGVNGPVKFLRASGALRSIVERERVDVVVAWLYHAMIASALPGALPSHVARVWNVRGTMPSRSDRLATRASASIARLFARRARRIVYNSSAARAEHEAAGFPAAASITIRNGYEVPAVESTSLARSPAATTPTVTMIARYHPMKDFAGFLAAIAILRQRGIAVRAELVGEGCVDSNPQLAAEIDATKTREVVTLTGRLDDVAPALARASVVCSSSAWGEGFHNVLAEAALAGVPVVSTDVGDAGLIVGDAESLVPPRDPEALANALLRILRAPPAQLIAWTARRRDAIAREFGVDTMRARYDALVREVAP